MTLTGTSTTVRKIEAIEVLRVMGTWQTGRRTANPEQPVGCPPPPSVFFRSSGVNDRC